jgi:hypothetical protein
MPNKLHMQDVSVSCPIQDGESGHRCPPSLAGATGVSGPWRCLLGCSTHRDGTPGDDPSECFASERIGATTLSEEPRGVALEVVVDQFAEHGVPEAATVAVLVQPQQRGADGLFVLTPQEARRHIAHLRAASPRRSAQAIRQSRYRPPGVATCESWGAHRASGRGADGSGDLPMHPHRTGTGTGTPPPVRVVVHEYPLPMFNGELPLFRARRVTTARGARQRVTLYTVELDR